MEIRVLLKAILFIIAILISFIAIFWFSPIDKSNFHSAIIDKEERLKNTQGNRIVLVGGSNFAFGVDSQLIKDSTGYEVVNMGLHAGLGIRFMINEIRNKVREGDIVIMAFAYSFQLYGSNSTLEILLVYPEAFSWLERKDILKFIDNFQVPLQRRFRGFLRYCLKDQKNINGIYNRRNFNQYGDMIGHLNLPPEKKLRGRIVMHSGNLKNNKILKDTVEFLNRFAAECREKKVKLFLTFPPVSKVEPKKLFANTEKFFNWLKKNSDVPLLGHPKYFIYPKRYFYDTVYHLNKRGRRIRTKKIIQFLMRALEKSPVILNGEPDTVK